MNIFQTIATSLNAVGELEGDISLEMAGKLPDYGPLSKDLLAFAQGKIKVPQAVTPEKLTALFAALHGVVIAILAFFEKA